MIKTKIGIVGGAGYTAGELIRILLYHPSVQIAWVHSTSNAGNAIHQVHQDLIGETDLTFTEHFDEQVDVVFLCTGHGRAASFVEENAWVLSKKVIDLSRDFRLDGAHNFVYALPEWQRTKISNANYLANPGCFATAVQLAILPLAQAGMLQADIHVNGITGSTGAGQQPTDTTHFSWRNNNVSVYKAFTHQHLDEIYQSARSLQRDFQNNIHFIPVRGNFTRGIMVTAYTDFLGTTEEAKALFEAYYAPHPFTHVVDKNPHLKQVVNTNKALLYVNVHEGKIFVVSMIDNLLKGASGQAVQNMNLMLGLDEKTGLNLKANAF